MLELSVYTEREEIYWFGITLEGIKNYSYRSCDSTYKIIDGFYNLTINYLEDNQKINLFINKENLDIFLSAIKEPDKKPVKKCWRCESTENLQTKETHTCQSCLEEDKACKGILSQHKMYKHGVAYTEGDPEHVK